MYLLNLWLGPFIHLMISCFALSNGLYGTPIDYEFLHCRNNRLNLKVFISRKMHLLQMSRAKPLNISKYQVETIGFFIVAIFSTKKKRIPRLHLMLIALKCVLAFWTWKDLGSIPSIIETVRRCHIIAICLGCFWVTMVRALKADKNETEEGRRKRKNWKLHLKAM